MARDSAHNRREQTIRKEISTETGRASQNTKASFAGGFSGELLRRAVLRSPWLWDGEECPSRISLGAYKN